jgi:quinol monooxygenase YgiN
LRYPEGIEKLREVQKTFAIARWRQRKRTVVQLLIRLTAPPGRLQQTIQALRSVMNPAHPERGGTGAHVSSDVGDGNVLYYAEDWPDVEGLNQHLQSLRFGRMLALMETAAEAPSLEFRFVSETRGLDYVAEVREAADRADDE